MTQPRLLGGRYELEGVVGRGGMAEVYRARDIRLDRIVAIKTLRADLARDQIFQARFRREAQSAASLNHPSIVAVYDTGEDMATGVPVPYIVMEYVDGRTVRDLLQEGHRLLPERSLEIIDGVLRALDYSHQAGIVHRDIKPGNVMVTRNGDVKVMDFGIARAMSDAQATMTQTAQVIGTAQYLSPEQARGERVDSRSDLYSTGCLLYELLCGRPPFTGDSPVAIAYQHVRENPVPPSRVDPDVPAWADAIVLKAMAKNPADRYQTAADMRADLQRAASGMPVAAAQPTRLDMYPGTTQRMGAGPMMAGATAQIPPVREYEYADRDYDRGGRGRRWIPWVLGLILVLAVVGGVAYYLLAGAGKKTAVPLVNGEPVAAAEQKVRQAHLIPVVTGQADSNVSKGLVIKTNPAEGNNVAANTVVTLYVSTGAAPVAVPNVVGEQQNQAESALQAKGFQVNVKTDPTAPQPAGQVISQNPSGGTAAPGSTVTITVSGGAVTVPSVIGYSQATATQVLNTAGFQVSVQQGNGPPQYANGTVFTQQPDANSTAARGSKVTIFVQNGASPSASPTPSPSATPTTSPTPTPTPTGSSTTSGGGGGQGGGHGGASSGSSGAHQLPGAQPLRPDAPAGDPAGPGDRDRAHRGAATLRSAPQFRYPGGRRAQVARP
ncbi:MAG: Stk1 family PASTA domain-containing Ser/Thr kinase [Actinobacteria bacterium]|nr:Stk1 family PASTA domain-containing Ser/Thr kinase [Actinomycetota bacterium]